MRLIFEHPWAASVMLGAIGFAFLWVGLRESLITRIKIGLAVIVVAIVILLTGLFVETPTEHARRVVIGFIEAVAEEKTLQAISFLDEEVILVDDWKGSGGIGKSFVKENLIELHRRHELKYNTVLKFVPIERDGDILVELSLFTRLSGIGSVPTRWRLLVNEHHSGVWKIYSIDAIEIAGRSYR